LFTAINELINNFDFVSYFPSYEIVHDDLRDYRFYNSDMLHINETGVNYIFEKFMSVYTEKETEKISREVFKLLLSVNHRTLFPGTNQHKTFLKKQMNKIEKVLIKYPFIDLNSEYEKLFAEFSKLAQ